MKQTYPTLYEKGSKGQIKQWSIEVKALSKTRPADIITTYGEKDGKLQTTSDTVIDGKNLGKVNETSPWEQANLEAKAKWEKKKKSGYVEDLAAASSGEVDKAFVVGGIAPMLAKSFDKDGGKIVFPCAGQPKLDGIRCIAVKKGQDVNLYSRTRKPITSCPHIVRAILQVFAHLPEVTLDGELYNHNLKTEFEKIVSLVRKDKPTKEAEELVQYHIYDVIDPSPFGHRHRGIFTNLSFGKVLCYVPTYHVEDETKVPEFFKDFKADGYEGLMLRNWNSPYEIDKRSDHLQKVKEFEDAEFKIIGVEEGRGKLQGNLGAFICVTTSGEEFKCKMSGEQESTKIYFQRPETVVGRSLTIQFQGLTGKNGVPRFPVGLRLREEGL